MSQQRVVLNTGTEYRVAPGSYEEYKPKLRVDQFDDKRTAFASTSTLPQEHLRHRLAGQQLDAREGLRRVDVQPRRRRLLAQGAADGDDGDDGEVPADMAKMSTDDQAAEEAKAAEAAETARTRTSRARRRRRSTRR